MKKLATLVFFVLFGGILSASTASNNPSELFKDDLSCFDETLSGLTELEQLVTTSNATYSQLAAEKAPLLKNMSNDHQDISASLLGAGSKDGMDPALKVVLIVLITLAVIACGCLLIAALAAPPE